MMEFAPFRNAYMNEYKNAINTYLNKDSLIAEVDSFANLIYYNSNFAEFMDFNTSVVTTKAFISQKYDNVKAELDTVQLVDTIPVITPILPPTEVEDWFINPEKYAYGYVDPTDTTTNDSIINTNNILSETFVLYNIFPNPANRLTILRFNLLKSENVKIDLFELSGKKVISINKELTKGINDVAIDVTRLNSGLYICKCAFAENIFQNKLIIYHP